jgi:ABC-2 type transport system ATP-binding protein
LVRQLQAKGVTIILTTHYIEEAEEMADRIGVINSGEIILVEEKHALMRRFGSTKLTIGLKAPLEVLPDLLSADGRLSLDDGGHVLTMTVAGEAGDGEAGVADLIQRLGAAGIDFKSIDMHRSSLEDIFVDLVRKRA